MAEKNIRNYWLWHYWHDDPDCRCPKCGNGELFTVIENNEYVDNLIWCGACRWEGTRKETGYRDGSSMQKQRCSECGHFETRWTVSESGAATWQCLKCGKKSKVS